MSENLNTEPDDILNQINMLKNKYYSSNTKNILFKNNQKFDCANTIVQNVDLNTLFSTIIRVDTNKLFFNYGVFKTVMNPNIYWAFISFIFETNEKILKDYPTYEVYLDVKGITPTGVERYKDFIQLLSKSGQQHNKNFLQKLNYIFILNPPVMVANLSKIVFPLLEPAIRDKFRLL
jgi:hypothetical protein